MMTKYRLTGAVIFLMAGLVVTSGMASTKPHDPGPDPIEAINRDYQQGSISLDEKAVLQITSIKNPEALPAIYRLLDSSASRSGLRGATMAITKVISDWDKYTDETRASLSAMLTRPPGSLTYRSLSGYFLMHYDVTGPDAVPSQDLDFSGIPDYVEKAASYCDTSMAKHIELGYMLPPSDGGIGSDSSFDVYFEEMPYYGYAVPEGAGPAEWNDYYSYLVLHRDFLGFPLNNDPEGNVAGAAKATCAHELQHCVQFGYNAFAPSWIMESDATCFEDLAFDIVDDNYNYLPSFMYYPWKSLMENSSHVYSAFIWEQFLMQKFDTALLVSYWEGGRYDPPFDALADSLWANHGTRIDSAFVEFTQWNYMTGMRYAGTGYEEGASYDPIAISNGYSNYPRPTINTPDPPAGYGCSYVPFYPGGETGNVRFTFDGDNNRTWAAYIIKVTSQTNYEFEQISLDPVDFSGSIEVFGFENYYQVIMVGVNLDEYSSVGNYTTAAEMFSGRAVTTTLLTDTVVYSGSSRDFAYQVFNPASESDVYRVSAWDDSGWVPSGLTEIFIDAGESVVVEFSVRPTLGTELGNSSMLHFKAASKNDTTISHQVDRQAVVVLQRGDANFDGPIDIGDLTYLINYLFAGGDDPLPIAESGNFDCVGVVDVADITRVIQYLFIAGLPSPCNPF